MGIRAVFINAEEQREVAPGATVFAEGDTGVEMYGLISGAVELRKGEQSLRLELARRRARTEEERARVPPPPGPSLLTFRPARR